MLGSALTVANDIILILTLTKYCNSNSMLKFMYVYYQLLVGRLPDAIKEVTVASYTLALPC